MGCILELGMQDPTIRSIVAFKNISWRMAFLKHKVFVSSLTFPGQHFNGSFEIWNFIKFSSQASIETVRTLSAKKIEKGVLGERQCALRERETFPAYHIP